MNVAEWILVVILSVTLFVFLVVGIIFFKRLIELVKKMGDVVDEGQDIAKNANGIVENIKGMTSIGGAIELFVEKYINPSLRAKTKNNTRKEPGDGREER